MNNGDVVSYEEEYDGPGTEAFRRAFEELAKLLEHRPRVVEIVIVEDEE